MKNQVYLCIRQATKVREEKVCVKDVGSVLCQDSNVENRIKAIKVHDFKGKKETRVILTAMKIIETILAQCPDIDIQLIGETDLLVEYDNKLHNTKVKEYIKVVFVCAILFFGAGFTIMAFNNDISINKLFDVMYINITGKEAVGFTVLEIGYSIGIFLGIMLFYNHIGPKRITTDPTPIEVEMRKYEQDINTTLIEGIKRKEAHIDAGNGE